MDSSGIFEWEIMRNTDGVFDEETEADVGVKDTGHKANVEAGMSYS